MRKTKMRLVKYISEEKRHYKLYKRKKTWVIAGITMFSSAVLLQVPVLADEVATLTLGESTTAQGTIQTDDKTLPGSPTTDQTAQETLDTNQASVEKETTATDETNEVTGDSVAKTESESVQTKEDKTTNTQTEQPSEATQTQAVASTSSFRSVAAVSNESVQADEKVIHLTSVSQENSGILDQTTAADGSTEYTFTTDNTSPNRGRLSMTVEYTGQNGDTFSMIVKPNATKGGILEAASNIDATGSPQKTALGDGSYKYTWTITNAVDNTNMTVKQTIKPINFFAEVIQNGAEPYPPYLSSAANDAMTVSGDNYQISFLINDVPAPTNTNVKITLDKRLLPAGARVETKADAYKENTTTNVTTDTNYLYQVEILDGNVVANVPTTVRGLAQVKVPVPEHFVLDVAETNKYLMHTSDPYLNGNLQVTQPGGEGTPIILTATKPIVFTTTSAKLSFIGHYTSTQTTGKSEAPSGWVDLGDGQRKYFGTVNIDTGEALDISGLSPEAKGFDQNVLAKDDPSVHENFGLIIHYSNSEQNSNHNVVLVSDYNSVKNSGTSVSDQKIDPVERPILDNGDKSAPVLYAVGLTANGLTEFTPTYHFEFPDEITTTGITLPINNVTNDHADFKSYNPAQTGYTVVVTGSDGSQITQRLQAGENYDPLTGQIDHFGEFRMGKKLASGVKITAYDVTPDVKYYANALQNSINGTNGSSALNDINSGMLNILGYLNSKAQVGQTYSSKIQVESENKRLTTAFQVKVSEPKKLPLQGYEWPSKGSDTYVKKTGDEFSMGFQTMGSVSTPSKGTNLDAGGVLVGKGNGTATDLPGHALTVEYGTVREPIVYLTVPEQTVLTNFAKSDKFYRVTYDKKYQNPVTPEPKVIQKQNINGQTVVILDWTGTGFELKPQMKVLFNLKVVSDAVNGFDVGRTTVDMYAYTEPGKEPALYTEADLKKKGISTDGLQVYKANVNATNNTSWIQLGGDTSKTELPASLQTQIQFADGTIAKTTMTDAGANTIQFRIVAPEEVKPAPLIQGTKNYSLSDKGINYPAKDYLDKDGQKQGIQTLQFGMVNNLANALSNVISVMNLPQNGVIDGNNPSVSAQAFTLNISGAGKLAVDSTNNHLHDAHTLYYATQPAVLSADGKTLTFADGTTWMSGQPIPSTLLTADQVADWSTIKSLVLDIPTLSMGNKIIYHFDAYSPTSETNMGKQVTLRQVGGYTGQKTLVVGTITDSYGAYATVKFVDQAGTPINGYPDLVGKATLNETTGEYELENSYLLGEVGKALSLPAPPTITGYKFIENQYSSTVFKADGSTVITRIYQVDQARLFENSLQGKLLDQATGDPQAGITQKDPTGTSEIKFTVTDEQLKRPGYTYKITVVDQNGTPLTNKVYDSLTEALEEQGIFDDKLDGQSVTQNFIVTYTADFQKAVIISGNDPSKQIPTSEAEATTAPYFHDGKTDGLMFYDQAGAPLVSDDMFARAGYRYTVIAPDGKTYNNFAAALAAKLRFDNTDNLGNSDSEVQVYRVVYTEDIQKVLVTIIDDQGQLNDDGSYTSTILVNKELLGQGLAGSAPSEETSQKYADMIKEYRDKGYEVVSKEELPTYDQDETTDQVVTVHLKHGTTTQEKTVDLTQTVTYKYKDGIHAEENAAPTYTKKYSFTATETVDRVTNKVIQTKWSEPQMTEVVASPTIAGYKADKIEVAAMQVSHDTEETALQTVVYYTPNIQKLNYKVIDDQTGTEIVVTTLLAQGGSENDIPESVQTEYATKIADLQKQGYVIVSQDELPLAFDTDDASDQLVVVHVKHGTKEVTGAPKTVTQTVTYVYGNGPKKGQSAADTYTKGYQFTSVDTIDTVTGATLNTVWSPAQTTEVIQSPTVKGYTPDRNEISGQTITHDSEDLSTVVTYTAGDQTVKVHYIDVYGGSNKELTDQLQTLTGKAGAAYTNTLWDYAQAGYKLDRAQPEATSGNFDEDPDTEQEYYVYLTHELKQVVGTPVTVSQTINYAYRTGPKAGQMVSADSVNSHTFVPTYTVDQVTKENIGEPSWTPETAEFSAVTSPTISGYTSDRSVVEKMTITSSSKDSVVTVYYDANEQRLTYTVIDDGDNGKVLANNELLATGDSESVVGDKVSTDYQALIQSYLDKGYVLVSADALPANFDNNDAVDQNVVLHLAHGTKEVTGTPKTVTQTVTYVYGNGPKKGQSAADTYTKGYQFTSVDTIDTVTGATLNTVWSPAQTTEVIQSPTVKGYTPDRNEISGQTITHDSEDLSTVVTYTAGDQTVKVHYIDVYGGSNKELTDQLQTLTGKAGAAYTNTLWDYAQAGYKLDRAQPEATSGNFDEDPDTEQEYYVYLTHELKQVVGTPVVVTDTINYIYGNGPKQGQPIYPPSVIEKTFVPTYTIDAVTGETIETTWSGDGKIASSAVPDIPGYTPDKTLIAERVLTPTMADQTQTVQYMLDEVPETKPEVSNDPTKAESLEENNDTGSSIEAQKSVETQAPISEKVSETQTKMESKVQLPQTGDASDTQKASFVGVMLTTLAGLLGFATKKRKKEDE